MDHLDGHFLVVYICLPPVQQSYFVGIGFNGYHFPLCFASPERSSGAEREISIIRADVDHEVNLAKDA